MLVSSGALNILLANNNKVLNDVLKEADSKTLENMVKNQETSGESQTKQLNPSSALKELFQNLTDGTKSNQTIENMLRNSSQFKELGNFSANFEKLLDSVKSDETLQKFLPKIESLAKNIENIDSNTLKEQIKNSGVFMENKLLNSETSKLEKVLSQVLNSLDSLKNIDNPKAKEIVNQIIRVLQNIPQQTQALQNQSLQNQSLQTQNLQGQNQQNQTTLNQVQNSQVSNQQPQNTQTSTNPILNNLANSIKEITTNLQNLSNNLNPNQLQNISNLANELKTIVNSASLVESKLENIVNNQKSPTLNQNITQQTTQNQQINILANNQVNITANSQTNISINSNQTSLINSSPQQIATPNISQNLVQNLIQNIALTIENEPLLKEQISNSTKEILTQIKTELTNNPSLVQNRNILPILDNLLKMDNLFIKNETLTNILKQDIPNQANIQSNTQANNSQQQTVQNSLNQPNQSSQATQTPAQNIVQNQTAQIVNNNPQTIQILQNQAQQNLQNQILNQNIGNENITNQVNTPKPSINNLNLQSQILNQMQIQETLTKTDANIQNQVSNNLGANLLNSFTNNFSNSFASNLNPLLDELNKSLESMKNPALKQVQNTISKLTKNLESIVQDSNLTLETKEKSKANEDMKSILLQMKEELSTKTDAKSQDLTRQVDRLLTQIDLQQLTSIVTNSNFVYVPFFWEMLEDGTIAMKKVDEDKFYCQINLNLKDFGKVDLMLALYDTNKMDLTIYAQRDHFKKAIQENMQELKIALNNADLIPVHIKLLDLKEDENEEDNPNKSYIKNIFDQSFGKSVDIRV